MGACGLCAGKRHCSSGSDGSQAGYGQGTGPALRPSTLGTKADKQPTNPGYLPAPRAAPALQQLHALSFLPSDRELLSLLPLSKPLADFTPDSDVSRHHSIAPRDQLGVRRVGLGAASKHTGCAWGVWRAYSGVKDPYLRCLILQRMWEAGVYVVGE